MEKEFNVFLSWGVRKSTSYHMAHFLYMWLPKIFPEIKCFHSERTLRNDKNSFTEINRAAKNADYGIVCVCPESKDRHWVTWETAKLHETTPFSLFLVALKYGDLEGPLSNLNASSFTRSDLFKMLSEINELLKQNNLGMDSGNLRIVYESYLDEIDDTFPNLMGCKSYCLTGGQKHCPNCHRVA